MARPNPTYQDGYVFPDVEVQVEPDLFFPFSLYPTPDRYSHFRQRQYNVLPKGYKPRITNLTSFTNLALYSQGAFSTGWTALNATVTDNVLTAPDGTLTASQLLETVTNANHEIFQSITVTNGPTTISVFTAPISGRRGAILFFQDSATTIFSAGFDLIRGVVVASSGATGSITIMPNGSVRISMTFTPATGAGTYYINASPDGTTASYAGTTTAGIMIWGAEVKTSSVAGPYIPTTSVTRTVLCPDQETTINPSALSPDPLAYLVAETDPKNVVSALAQVTRTFSRIPNPQTVPASYLFTAPNFTPVAFSQVNPAPSGYTAPSNAYGVFGNYGVISISNFPLLIGYYGKTMAIGSYTGSPATTLNIAGHNYKVGQTLLYARTSSLVAFTFLISSVVAGVSVTGVSTSAATTGDTLWSLLSNIIGSADTVRLRTRNTVDTGQVLSLNTQVIEAYDLPGVTSGINTATDISPQGQFNLADYLAAWEGLAAGSSQVINDVVKVVAFTGKIGTGNTTATGLLQGDKLLSVWSITDSADNTSYFSACLNNQITQIANLNLSTKSLLAIVLSSGAGVWFNVLSPTISSWKGPILKKSITQALLASNISGF